MNLFTMNPETPQATMPALHYSHPEPEERMPLAKIHTPKFPARFAEFPPEWRGLIVDCWNRQQDLELSDRAFAGTVLSATSWNQLINGAYPLPKSADGVKSVLSNLKELARRGDMLAKERDEKKHRKEALSIAQRFIARDELEDVLGALDEARSRQKRGLEERVVIVIGATRSGKSWMIEKLKAEQQVQWHMKASGGIKTRYRAFLEALASTMRLREIEGKTVDALEKSIMSKLTGIEGVLAVEELQRYSPRALEFFKDLLNHTKVSLLFCMQPGQFRRMSRSGHEDMQQFLGRSVLHVELKVSANLVHSFAPEVWDRCSEAAKMCRIIADEAEKGGGMSLVREVCEAAAFFAPRRLPVTSEHISKALAAYRRAVPVMSRTSAQAFGVKKAA